MGHGAWDDNAYRAAATFRRATGAADFAYSARMRTRPAGQWKADPAFDPQGVTVREARDGADHPNSTPIVVLFDVTGSMGVVPQIMQTAGRTAGPVAAQGIRAGPADHVRRYR